MATFPYDNMTLQSLMQSLPDVQRKKRRAEELRRTQEQFRAMGSKQATGSMLPTQQGGLYETVARYRPDYAGMANQAIGGLGDYLTGKQAETAQGGYDEAQTQALLGGVQQLSREPPASVPGATPDMTAPQEAMPTQQTLRTYIGMLGGPDLKDFLPKDPSDLRARDNEIDEEGFIWSQMRSFMMKCIDIPAWSRTS